VQDLQCSLLVSGGRYKTLGSALGSVGQDGKRKGGDYTRPARVRN